MPQLKSAARSGQMTAAKIGGWSMVPTVALGMNRHALVENGPDFVTKSPKGVGPRRSYSATDTAGCSCRQICAAKGLGLGHMKFGCTIGEMDIWVEEVTGL